MAKLLGGNWLMRHAVFAAAIVISLAPNLAHAKDWRLASHPSEDQRVTYEDGYQVVWSNKDGASGAALVITAERFGSKQTPTLMLRVKNHSDDAVNFTLGNVRVSADAGDVSVLSISDIEAEARAVEKRAKQAAMWQAIAVGLQAGSAGMSQTSTYRSNTFTPYGSVSTYGTVTTPGNQAASAAILANGQSQIAATREMGRIRAAEIMEAAQSRGFRPSTIEPHGEMSTPVTLTRFPGKTTSLRIEVDLNGEVHAFAFDVSQVK